MLESTIELAENKLIVLYIIEKVNYPISNTQLSEIVLENNLMNYFVFQQYLTELISSKFILEKSEDNKPLLLISDKGSRVLNLFNQRISSFKINIIDDYLKKHMAQIKKERTIHGDYTITEDNTFLVELKALEGSYTIIDLKLSVATKKQAQDLCNKWNNNSSELYNKILKILID
ncbi:MAG: DUF4364 family protein [Clostridiaceae bacterium]